MHVVKGQVKYTLTGLEDVLLAVAALGDGVTIASASQVPVSLLPCLAVFQNCV